MVNRLTVLVLFFLFSFLVLIGRLFYWQVLRGKDLSSQARVQHEFQKTVAAPRGSILAKDGSYLVARGDAYLVFAELPKLKQKPQDLANRLAPLLVKKDGDLNNYETELLAEVHRLEDLLSKKEIVWVALKAKVKPEVKDQIEKLGLEGIGFEKVDDRLYPEASSAAHLLGFVGKTENGTDMGYFGLEGFYNISLTGKPGHGKEERNAVGQPILFNNVSKISAIDGVNLKTHLDKAVQMIVERELADSIVKYGAQSGSVIVMEPFSGAVIAMASYPSYDPSKYWQYNDELFKNPVVSSGFEPGSIFKILVMASALDAGVVEPDTKCDICDGPLKVDKYFIETWNKQYNPNSNMQDVIVHSDNVGMAFVSQKMGADMLFDYLDKFGFGRLTGIDLQGEISPSLRKRGTWNVVDLATASFGQGVAITPIQMITAVAAIANGGQMVTPQVVSGMVGPDWYEEVKPVKGKRVLSEEAAREITAMMVEAAKNGEAKWTALKGFKVAGKTGTAQIPIAGHYDSEKTIASFVGFAPADKAKFVMLVTLREPKSSIWASETAAPLWYTIAKGLFPYLGIQPES